MGRCWVWPKIYIIYIYWYEFLIWPRQCASGPLCFADVCTKGDEDLELGGEEALDSSAGISKRDIHTLNEQRRRDVIKVGSYVNCYTHNNTVIPSELFSRPATVYPAVWDGANLPSFSHWSQAEQSSHAAEECVQIRISVISYNVMSGLFPVVM